jgi:uroporphyrinogen decarboxylase
MIYDFLDKKKIMQEFCEYYTCNTMAYLKKVSELAPKPDFVLIHGSNCSASLISPYIFEYFALPFIKKVASLLKEVKIFSVLHICGKCNEWLDMVADTDVDVMDALEHPPAGNIELAEVKKRYGHKFCLKGNVSAIKMACGTIVEVQDEVKYAIDAAANEGGFLLDVGDSIGPKVNLENVMQYVKTAIEYGKC